MRQIPSFRGEVDHDMIRGGRVHRGGLSSEKEDIAGDGNDCGIKKEICDRREGKETNLQVLKYATQMCVVHLQLIYEQFTGSTTSSLHS